MLEDTDLHYVLADRVSFTQTRHVAARRNTVELGRPGDRGLIMPTSPTAAQLEFSLRTRKRRRELGLSAEEVAGELDVSRVYLSSIENSRAVLSDAKLPKLIEVLDLSKQDHDELSALLMVARQPAWWASYSKFMQRPFDEFVGLESAATRVRAYESRLITGLLQTESYAAAVVKSSPEVSLADLKGVVELRMRRQARLLPPDPLELQVILCESALLQQFGGREILETQLISLLDRIESHRSNLQVYIQPFSKTPLGFTVATTAVLLEFDSPHLPTIGWEEGDTSSQLIDDPDTVAHLTLRFDQARLSTLSLKESEELIKRRLDDLRREEPQAVSDFP